MSNTISHDEHYDPEGSKIRNVVIPVHRTLSFWRLFLVYAVFRNKYSADFHHAASRAECLYRNTNTVVLLVSSMTVAMSITAIQKKNTKLAMLLHIYYSCSGSGIYDK